MMQNNIELYELKYNIDNLQIIGREKIAMTTLIKNLVTIQNHPYSKMKLG